MSFALPSIKSVFAALGVILLLSVGIYTDRQFFRNKATPKTRVDTVEKKVPKIVKDTVLQEKIKRKTVYKTNTDTVVKRVSIPTDLKMRGVLPKNYISIGNDEVEVTYWKPTETRYISESFALNKKNNKFALGIFGFGTNRSVTLSPYIAYERDRMEIKVGYGPTFFQNRLYWSPTVQIGVDLIQYRF